MMCKTYDFGILLLTVLALVIFYIVFNSDLFAECVLRHFPSTLNMDGYGEPSANLKGQIIIMTLIVVCFLIVYLLSINLL